MTLLEELLEDMEETYAAEGSLALYQLSWFLRGLGRDLSEDEIAGLCQRGFNEFTKRHRLQLEWFDWPDTDPSAGRPAENGTPPDFDIHTTGEIESPFLVLVPDRS